MSEKKVKETAINSYFSWLEKTVHPESTIYQAAHSYMEQARRTAQNEGEHNGPFLSIVTRTQGKRPEMLSEILLCLTAQSNTDFELLIMGHNMTDEQTASVKGILENQPEWFRKQVRFIPVSGGTRTTPLNEGFANAKGKYIAVLDDDDLVFDHWVETFYQMHLEHDGKILHTYSVNQDWQTLSGEYSNTPRSISAPDKIYCHDFHLLDELRSNSCPLCALAFPAYAYHELGIRFDETLTTTEDWDYLMRVSMLTGVADSAEVTFLYRIWKNTESSATVHNQAEWKRNYKKIVTRLGQMPILAAPGALKDVIDPDFIDGGGTYNANDAEMFYDDGEGMTASKKWKLDLSGQYPDCRLAFVPLREEAQAIKVIRLDPQNLGFLTMKDVSIRVILEDDSVKDYTLADAVTNGLQIEDRLVFLKNDPQILLFLPEATSVKAVLLFCEIIDHVSDQDVDLAIRVYGTQNRSFAYRALRKIYRTMKKIVGK